MPLDEKLLAILACPACDDRPPVKLQGDELVCDKCERHYPIEHGVPVMVPEKASKEEK